MSWQDHVYPHGPLTELAPGLWFVQGSLGRSPLPRNMVLYRLEDGGLLVHSAVALDEAAQAEVEKLGQPSVLVVPNRMHRADAGVYKARYPDIQIVCPAAARAAVEKVVAVDALDTEVLPDRGVVCHAAAGDFEHTYELAVDGGHALVFTDGIFHMVEHLPGFTGWMARYVTASTGFFGTSRLGRMFLGSNKATFKAWLEAQSAREGLVAVTMSHGIPVTTGAAAKLKEASARL